MRHTESETQRFCVKWFRLQYPQLAKLLFAVPNGGARNLTEAAIMKGEGVTAGVSDMLLMYPTDQYHGLCIEFKTAKGKQTQAQKEWQEIIEMRGYKYVICRTFEDFERTIKNYFAEAI